MSRFTKEEAWDYLIDNGIASEETLRVVTAINGWSLGTLEDVLYATTAYESFDQLEDEDSDSEEEDKDDE